MFVIIDGTTREPCANPLRTAIRKNRTVGLTPNRILIRRDGTEFVIDDSAAPIHDQRGLPTGAVMVFHDVSVARAMEAEMLIRNADLAMYQAKEKGRSKYQFVEKGMNVRAVERQSMKVRDTILAARCLL